MDQIDPVDFYGTFTDSEARRNQMATPGDDAEPKGSIMLQEGEKGV
jgi:hypothetical protein